jgi:hypothetical protein
VLLLHIPDKPARLHPGNPVYGPKGPQSTDILFFQDREFCDNFENHNPKQKEQGAESKSKKNPDSLSPSL